MGVSVITTVFNGAAYLRASIDSVLAQTLPPLELIVIDDGSVDETPAILASYGGAIRAHSQPNGGQSAAMVAGIAMARGDMLAFNDADDLWAPGKNELQVRALEADTTLDAVFGHVEQFVSPELDYDAQRRLAPPNAVLTGEAAPCMTVRRAAYDRIGSLDPSLDSSYFVDWLGRAKAGGMKSLMLEDIVLRRRLHENNWGRRESQARDRLLLKALRRHIVRGRGDAPGEQG
jgi:glycosyltransferase involved in cell wall biosynthesis